MWLKPPGPPLTTLIVEEEGFFLSIINLFCPFLTLSHSAGEMVLPSPPSLDASAGWDGHEPVQLIDSPPWRALQMLGRNGCCL